MQRNNGLPVETPRSSPVCFHHAWRAEIAKFTLRRGLVLAGPDIGDDMVYLQHKYLTYQMDPAYRKHIREVIVSEDVENPFRAVALANALHEDESNTSDKIEALLLCPTLSLGDIGKQFNMWPIEVGVYEKLFFNVRNDDYEVRSSRHIRERFVFKDDYASDFSLQDEATGWRAMAFKYGADALFAEWGWPEGGVVKSFSDIDANQMLLKGAYKEVADRLRSGRGLQGRDVVQIFGDVSQRFEGYRSDGILSSNEAVTGDTVAANFLKLIQVQRAEISNEVRSEQEAKLGKKLSSMGEAKGRTESNTSQTLDAINAQMQNKGA